jgi:plasmid maintenance system killer protein
MIVSFGDKTAEDIFHGDDTKAARRITRALWTRVQIKLDLLNASTTLEDLRVPPVKSTGEAAWKLGRVLQLED